MSIREKLMSYTIKYKLKKECNRNEILFLNKDVISDKVVADCVESIIGLYLIVRNILFYFLFILMRIICG